MHHPTVFRRDDRFISIYSADRRSHPVFGALAGLLWLLAMLNLALAFGVGPHQTDAEPDLFLELMGP